MKNTACGGGSRNQVYKTGKYQMNNIISFTEILSCIDDSKLAKTPLNIFLYLFFQALLNQLQAMVNTLYISFFTLIKIEIILLCIIT